MRWASGLGPQASCGDGRSLAVVIATMAARAGMPRVPVPGSPVTGGCRHARQVHWPAEISLASATMLRCSLAM
ncbi:hypothetical protein XarbCFBP8147_19145 [Xanthomonas arboricola]|nr:hypothetical protein XarbCFBP8147_19145 [Xanthomonas arboricola]